jgi:ribosomal-protein-alanine N-acetyltransferase
MQIRRMTEEDLNTVSELEQQIFPDPWSKNSLEYEINQNPFCLPLILENELEIIGYAIVWKIFEEFHIANFAIKPDYQGKKLGKRFLENLLTLRGNCKFALLEVRENNKRAIQLYEKFGFKTVFKRKRYYKNGDTALVMQKIFIESAESLSKTDQG